MISLVPSEATKIDPRTIAYNFPSMSVRRFSTMMSDYIYWKAVKAAEEVAYISGKILVPGVCVHWQRRQKLIDRRVLIQGKAFFVMTEDELTKNEKEKFDGVKNKVIDITPGWKTPSSRRGRRL